MPHVSGETDAYLRKLKTMYWLYSSVSRIGIPWDMRQHSFTFTFIVGALSVLAVPSNAQTQLSLDLGPRIGLDRLNGSRLLAGAEARIHVPNQPLAISSTFGYHFVDDLDGSFVSADATVIQGGINGLYYSNNIVELEDLNLNLYVGTGLAVTRFSTTVETSGFGSNVSAESTDTMLGLNFLGGIALPLESRLKPFVQGRLTLGQSAELEYEEFNRSIETEGGDFLTATVGLLFSL